MSARIGHRTRDDINKTVMEMISRPAVVNRFPLDMDSQLSLWLGAQPAKVSAAYATLLSDDGPGINTISWVNKSRINLRREGAVYEVSMYSNAAALPSGDVSKLVADFDWAVREFSTDARGVIGEWLETSAAMSARIIRGKQTFRDVMAMANTPGQLARMLPCLLKYLPKPLLEQFAEQEKRSALPSVWATYNRDHVADFTGLLALCHLLPPVQDQITAGGLLATSWERESMVDGNVLDVITWARRCKS